tara:strand:- start:933 stop:1100 length:168 start_codon:yes stop_codon:yes gene_type:complete
MQSVKIYFKNPKFNYSTNANGTKEELEKYFVGTFFDVGIYPRELLRECIQIEILK